MIKTESESTSVKVTVFTLFIFKLMGNDAFKMN